MTETRRRASERRVFICSCEKTMALDEGSIARGCAGSFERADQLCRHESTRLAAALQDGGPITVACTQEEPLFAEMAEDAGFTGALSFVNIREQAGWSAEGRQAGPKMAALLAAAAVDMPPISTVSLESQGVTLVLGRDETAIEVAARLADHLDITVLLVDPKDVTPPAKTVFPVLKGRVRNASGHLGAFELTIDDYALPSPSSRSKLIFGAARNGAESSCDLIIDLTGDQPLFSADDLRDGYLRVDPRDNAAIERLILKASGLVGIFDKPRYVTFDASICAHSRSTITGCTRCLDLCPTGAITPDGDHVAIDAAICAGCGQCAGACPTGAVSYALPPVDAVTEKLRVMLSAYFKAGGTRPAILLHDGDQGAPLIDALARFGQGLPARVIPLLVNEITQTGPELLAAAVAYGADRVFLASRARPKHDLSGLTTILAMTNRIFSELGYGDDLVQLIETDDPDQLGEALAAPGAMPARTAAPASFLPPPEKRGLLELAFRELHRAAPSPVDVIALERGAPFGGIEVDVDGCTLCLSCVSACPANAITDNPDRPTLRFSESLCVQCGLCEATCPEDVITLAPRLDFTAWAEPKRLLKEEEPHHCIECGKAFGTRSTINRVIEKLESHWMFSGPEGEQRRRVLEMCEDCRVAVVVKESFDPHQAETRRVRTTDDYLREREERNQSRH
jgi:ferredoxin